MIDVAGLVAQVRAAPERRAELLALLDERHPVHAQQSAARVTLQRGWVLHLFEEVGLPPEALPYVDEELESGHDAYLVAAAARAVRGLAAPHAELAARLVQAIANIRDADDFVSFEQFGAVGAPGQGRTALSELFCTLRWLGPSALDALPALEQLQNSHAAELSPAAVADLEFTLAELRALEPATRGRAATASAAPATHAEARTHTGGDLDGMEFEDHAGRKLHFDQVFKGRPALVAFFYTRCKNPRKCSLTIARLAQLQRRLAAEGLADRVRTAAVTYDPAFDTPARLRTYGEARGLRLTDDHRMLRATGDFLRVRRAFGLGVGYLGSLVNRHRIELFVLDQNGRVAASFVRVAWNDDEVFARLHALLRQAPAPPARLQRARELARTTLAVLPALALALFPKCPLCWGAYFGAAGLVGLEQLPLARLVPVFATLIVLGALRRRADAMTACC